MKEVIFMKIGLKKLFVLLIFLSILTLSAVNASDINMDDGIKDTDSNYHNRDIQNSNNIKIGNDDETYSNLENIEEDDSKIETDNPNPYLLQDNPDEANPEDDSTDINQESDETNGTDESDEANLSENNSSHIIKTTPKISIKTSKLKSRDTLTIFLKNSSAPLAHKKVTLIINKKTVHTTTNKEGIATVKLFLLPKTYRISIKFYGDDYLNPVSKKYNLKVKRLSTKIQMRANYVVRKNRLYIYLIGKDYEGVSKRKVILKFRKRTYKKITNKNGRISLKINLPIGGRYKISAKFKGDKYFKKSSKKFKFYVTRSIRFNIGNRKLLKNGYIRIYLKGQYKRLYSHKKMTIKIGSKKFRKRTNSEGIIVFRPNVKVRNYTVVVKYGKYSVYKRLIGVNKTIKDPLKDNISMVGGAPDTDYMPGSYVMGDDSATYTLKRSQYREVLKRDSYCLFLNNKLSKYVFFKTKNHPKLNHIIKREKWNVIEREINKKLVRANKHNYWPGTIRVSLKGRAYKYSEVRDVQNTGYTCGPTSASVCSQVLRNYVCERYLAKLAKTTREGTDIPKLEKALNKNNFTCTYFYRDSFKIGLNELKKGGCAIVFHAQNHYVSILDISKNGKKVLVSNSYGSYDGIPTKWISVGYMNKKFGHFDDSLVIRLNYTLSNSKKNSINCYYNSMGRNWYRHGPHSKIGRA